LEDIVAGSTSGRAAVGEKPDGAYKSHQEREAGDENAVQLPRRQMDFVGHS
jgi:hypothetical protein